MRSATTYQYPDVTVADVVVHEIVDRIIKVNDLDDETRRGVIMGLATELDVPLAIDPSSSAGWLEIVEHYGVELVEAVARGVYGWDHRQREVARLAERVAAQLMELVKEWRGTRRT